MLSNPAWLHRLTCIVAALVLLVAAQGIFAIELPLTVEQAWQIAEDANPTLKAAQASLAAAQGQVTDSRGLLWNNPHVSANGLRRMVPNPSVGDDTQREWRAQVSQQIEIAGQQGYRRAAAKQDLAAIQESAEEAWWLVRAEVEKRFVRVLSLQARVAMEQELVTLIPENVSIAKTRFVAGEDKKLDHNLAEVELGRAINKLEVAREQLLRARAEIAAMLQLQAKALPEVEGSLFANGPSPYSLEHLFALASNRPRLRAFDLREQAARSRLGLERAAVYPDVTVSLFAGREGPVRGRERIVALSVSLPLPLLRRNAAGIRRGGTELTHAQLKGRPPSAIHAQAS
ncbi:TolC family protein [Cupriavidus necator]|uniref:TolC family protein n=1 Tax=Cupriavidus necator TaxID=106590 RepID=UPI00339D71E4